MRRWIPKPSEHRSVFVGNLIVCLPAAACVLAIAAYGLIRFVPPPSARPSQGRPVAAVLVDDLMVSQTRLGTASKQSARPEIGLEWAAEIEAAEQLGSGDARFAAADRARSPSCRLALYCEAQEHYARAAESLKNLAACRSACAEMILTAAARRATAGERARAIAQSIGCAVESSTCACLAPSVGPDCR